MRLKHLFISLCFVFAQTLVEAQLEKGPLQDKTFRVKEGTPATAIYQFEKSNARSHSFVLEGEKDNLFEILSDGTLQTTGQLNWLKKRQYSLQVKTVDSGGALVEGPRHITIIVEDINNHVPIFNQTEYYGKVREQSRRGKTFLTVYASDDDDPSTPNAQLVYKIVNQIPDPLNVPFFQIDNSTGEISTTINGTMNLKADANIEYELVLSVSDKAERPFSSNAKAYISVTENLWKEPKPVSIEENSVLPHPHYITQVRWNDDNVLYELHQRERYPRFPFVIDKNGDINVTEPLDREEQQQYIFFALAKSDIGVAVARPLQIEVNVADVNDNAPKCPAEKTMFEVQENEDLGSTIGTFEATDDDKPNTGNSVLRYKLLEQLPRIPAEQTFLINEYTGVIQLIAGGLNIQDTNQYGLKVNVSDDGKPALSTICWIVINVIDKNDHIPIFEKENYGGISVRENTPVGTVVMEIKAWDEDQKNTGSSAIIYQIAEGDPGHMFHIETNSTNQRGYIKIIKPLDYETYRTHRMVIEARNPEPLVTGVQYNESSTTLLHIWVIDVDEVPVFSQSIYQIQIPEDTRVGSMIITVNASDPENNEIRYSLTENPRNWLRIDEKTGEIYVNHELDRETESSYTVRVIATEKANPKMSSSVYFHLYLDDVNDNAPRLAKDYYGDFTVCYPFSTPQSFEIQGTDADYSHWGTLITFRLGDGNVTNDWVIASINRTAARLSMKHANFPKQSIFVPVIMQDNGRPPLEATVLIPVLICSCTSKNQCETKPPEDMGLPSIGLALGILFGVLGVIGIILAAVFISLNKKKKKQQSGQDGTAAERERMQS